MLLVKNIDHLKKERKTREHSIIKDVRAQKFPRTDFFLKFGLQEKMIKLDEKRKKIGGHRTRFEDKAYHRP